MKLIFSRKSLWLGLGAYLLYAVVIFALSGCDQAAREIERDYLCEEPGLRVDGTDCTKRSVYYSCVVRRPILFSDLTLAYCKDEKDCREVCEKK
jgi:hypothetical protein